MYSNNIMNFQESTTILNTYTKESRNLLKAPRIYKSFVPILDIGLKTPWERRITREVQGDPCWQWDMMIMRMSILHIISRHVMGL